MTNLTTRPVEDGAMELAEAARKAEELAVYLWETHYKNDAPHWQPRSGHLMDLLFQIDNSITGLTRPSTGWRTDGLAEAIGVAWGKYLTLFGEQPHGTQHQIKAMLALLPAPPSDDARGSEDYSTRNDGSPGTEAPRTKSSGA